MVSLLECWCNWDRLHIPFSSPIRRPYNDSCIIKIGSCVVVAYGYAHCRGGACYGAEVGNPTRHSLRSPGRPTIRRPHNRWPKCSACSDSDAVCGGRTRDGRQAEKRWGCVAGLDIPGRGCTCRSRCPSAWGTERYQRIDNSNRGKHDCGLLNAAEDDHGRVPSLVMGGQIGDEFSGKLRVDQPLARQRCRRERLLIRESPVEGG